jgi:hypothetical protein
MSWQNNNFGFEAPTPEEIEIERQRLRRRKLKSLGIPQKYLDSNIEGLRAVIESSKEGPLSSLPSNIEGEVAKSMGFKGKNFKNAWRGFKHNVGQHREKLRLKQEQEDLRRQEILAIIEAEREALRAEYAREQAERNAIQAIRNREQAMRNELERVQRELKPSYLKAAAAIKFEENKRKSRKARGKNNYGFSMFSKENSPSKGTKVNKRNKTKERNTLRKKK